MDTAAAYPVIATTHRNFWIAQLTGWSLMGLSNLAVQSMLGFPASLLWFNTVTPVIFGLLVTTVYHYGAKRYLKPSRRVVSLFLQLLGATVLQTIGFLVLVTAAFRVVMNGELGFPTLYQR